MGKKNRTKQKVDVEGKKHKQAKGKKNKHLTKSVSRDTLEQQGKSPRSNGKGKLSELQQKMKLKLEGARFRQLNEQLYTTRGEEAFASFSQEPTLFEVYHRGFREMTVHWPENPLDQIIRWVQKYHSKAVIADLGCGDARLAESVSNRVHSFDLVSLNPNVTACDIASLPLPDNSVDICVFCLALMGTNLSDYIREAARILHDGKGILKIAEVRSRFEGADSGGGLEDLKTSIENLGFECTSCTADNKMFAMMEFKSSPSRATTEHISIRAKPCLYKRR
mmetsp:Transcript_22339/g.30506  ORF Transcript_22339/g.30506 Transcript_22339/m.30506 type:complete len:279 (-) Transcript_22339:346-1182(-)